MVLSSQISEHVRVRKTIYRYALEYPEPARSEKQKK